jgi:hypothetical protein
MKQSLNTVGIALAASIKQVNATPARKRKILEFILMRF